MKISVFAVVSVLVASVQASSAEPFTISWNSQGDFSAFRDDAEVNSPLPIARELPVFASDIQEYKVEGLKGRRILAFIRGSAYRQRKYPYAVSTGNLAKRKPYGFEKLFMSPEKTIESPYACSGKPFFIYERMSRPPFFLPKAGTCKADRNSYEKWKKAHPGFLGFNSLWEFDSDSEGLERAYANISNDQAVAEIQKVFPPKKAPGLAHRVEWARTAFKMAEEFHFGETNIWPLCSYNPGYEHIFAACGAAGLWYEATGQHPGSWAVSAAYLRGAARQWGLPYGWYMAHYRVGYNRNNQLRKGDLGVSVSLHRRQVLYGWLIGAEYMRTEAWAKLYQVKKEGRVEPTDYARELNSVYQIASRTERGDPFTPLAVLTPLCEPSDSNYVRRNGKLLDPISQCDVFDTLVPIRGDNGKDPVSWELGEQGCMYNSEFGGIFDVLCPDSGQDSARFAKALSRYRHVLLVSDKFNNEKFDAAALAAFEKAGGKVHRYPSPGCDTKEKLRELLLKIQTETMPVSVVGDIQWGVNKTSKGYLVYLINNKGVKSYFGEVEEFIKERIAKVTVRCKASGETRTVEVKPGDFKLLEFNK